MNLNLLHNYIYTRQLDLDLVALKESALYLKDYVKNNIVPDGTGYDSKGKGKVPAEAQLFSQYNLLMYPLPQFYELYQEIKNTFHAANVHQNGDSVEGIQYYAQCWLNVYQAGEYIDWHYHWLPEYNAWHGFYCLDVEPQSHTSYRLPGITEEIVVESKNNMLVLGKSDGDLHKSSEWYDTERPRITIAFDILPADKLRKDGYQDMLNHWVPI